MFTVIFPGNSTIIHRKQLDNMHGRIFRLDDPCSATRNEFLPFPEVEITIRLVSVTLQVQKTMILIRAIEPYVDLN